MSYIGIGSPIPDISSLPGQTGGEIEVTLDYPSAAVCSNGSDQTPSVKSPNGGTFSSTPSGLSINSSSGVVDVSESTPNNYTISYTVDGVVSSFAFTINQLEQSTFSYSASSFQQIGTATPTLASGTTAGGTFSASTGVVINTSTGVIDLAASTIGGPYTITYTTPGTCSTSSTFTLSITAVSVELIDNDFAMEFDGTDDYIDIGSSLYVTGSKSFSFWIKRSSSSPSNDGGVLTIVPTGGTTDYISVALWQNYIQVQTSNNTTTRKTVEETINTGSWYHVVVVKSNNSIDNIYINGVNKTLSNFGTWTGTITTPQAKIAEATFSGTDYNFTGDIDEVAIWNRSLALEDVQRIYNATANNPGKTANLFTAGLNTGLVYWNRMGD